MQTEALILEPEQRFRECGCPKWVLRCAHLDTAVLVCHKLVDVTWICFNKKGFKTDSNEAFHRGHALCRVFNHTDWEHWEAKLLAGELDHYEDYG